METLEIAKVLEAAGIPHDPAYKIAEAINGRSGLATKEDLHVLKEDLQSEIAELRTEVKEEIAELRTSLKWTTRLILLFGTLTIGMFLFLLSQG